jgi:hypothetical protein
MPRATPSAYACPMQRHRGHAAAPGASGYAEGNPLGIDLTIWPYVRVYADGITLGIAPAIFFLLFQFQFCCNPVPVHIIDQIHINII